MTKEQYERWFEHNANTNELKQVCDIDKLYAVTASNPKYRLDFLKAMMYAKDKDEKKEACKRFYEIHVAGGEV